MHRLKEFKKFGELKKYGIKGKWFSFILLVFVLPVICSLILCNYMSDKIEEGVVRNNLTAMNYIEQNVHNVLLWNEKFCDDLVLNKKINQIGKMKGEITPEERYEISEFSKEFSRSISLNDAVEDVYILFKEIDTIVSTSVVVDSRTYYNATYSEIFADYDEWLAFTEKSHNNFFNGTMVDKGGRDHLFYSKRWSTAYGENIFLVTKISTEKLKVNFSNIHMSDNGRLLLVYDGDVVYSYGGDIEYAGIDFGNLSQPRQDVVVDGEKCVILSKSMPIGGVSTAYVIRQKDFLKDTLVINIYMFLVYAIIIFLGIFLVRFILAKMYKPIKNLVGVFDGSKDDGMDEFEFIMGNIKNREDERNLLLQLSNEQRLTINKQKLAEILRGYYAEGNVDEVLAELGIDSGARYFSVLRIEVLQNESNNLSTGYNEAIDMAQKSIDDILSGYSLSGACVNDSRSITYLISSDAVTAPRFKQDLQELIREIYIKYSYKVIMILSKQCDDIFDISNEYRNVTDVFNFESIPEQSNFIDCSKIERSNGKYYYSMEHELRLMENLKSGDAEAATALIEKMFEKSIGENRGYNTNFAEFLVHDITATIVKFIEISDKETIRLNSANVIQMIYGCKTVDGMKKSILEFIQLCCAASVKGDIKRKKKLVDEIINFVSENYGDVNLNVSMIADRLQLYQNYVSMTFKKEMKIGLLEYINNYRMDKAAELLVTTDMNIESISEAVGSGYRTFCRNFSRKFGITAKRYREVHSQKYTN